MGGTETAQQRSGLSPLQFFLRPAASKRANCQHGHSLLSRAPSKQDMRNSRIDTAALVLPTNSWGGHKIVKLVSSTQSLLSVSLQLDASCHCVYIESTCHPEFKDRAAASDGRFGCVLCCSERKHCSFWQRDHLPVAVRVRNAREEVSVESWSRS